MYIRIALPKRGVVFENIDFMGIGNILHVVPGISDKASGPAYSVVRLCESLAEIGNTVQLVALDWAPLSLPPPFYKSFPLGMGIKRLGFSRKMREWLRAQAVSGTAHIIHNHSLWMMPNVYTGMAVRNTNCRLVVSPRGALSPWILQRSKWAKRMFWILFQKSTLLQAVCFHATAEIEYRDIRALGFKQPVALIPNGIDIPELPIFPLPEKRILLYLGRIHPKKGVDILLNAWRGLQGRFPEWRLEIIGPDNEGYLGKMKKLAGELSLTSVTFRGPLYGTEKFDAYRRADLYVLPTHSENFGITVAEALASGTPAVVTKGAPWSGLEKEKCGWWIDIGVGPLTECLSEAMSKSTEELAAMGGRGRAWMERDFSWERIGEMMYKTYEWVLGGGPPPDWVVTD